jgi:hypothetical protein
MFLRTTEKASETCLDLTSEVWRAVIVTCWAIVNPHFSRIPYLWSHLLSKIFHDPKLVLSQLLWSGEKFVAWCACSQLSLNRWHSAFLCRLLECTQVSFSHLHFFFLLLVRISPFLSSPRAQCRDCAEHLSVRKLHCVLQRNSCEVSSTRPRF